MARPFTVAVVGVSHKTAKVELRERLAVPPVELPQTLARIKALPGVEEAALVCTCNRVELYLAGAEGCAASARAWFDERAPKDALDGALFERHDRAAVEHLFRVAASLDSMVVGEAQVLGQVKDSFAACQSAGSVGGALARLFQAAFSMAKRVRTETAIGAASVSMASVAAELALKVFETLEGRTTLLIGAGEMSELTARHLSGVGSRLVLANRTLETAEVLARRIGGEAASLELLPELLARADIVVCSTGAQRPIITTALVQGVSKARRHRPLFLIDLSVPRNVEDGVRKLESVYAYNVDDLKRIADEGVKAREAEIAHAEAIAAEEIDRFARESRRRGAMPVVGLLRARGEAIASEEIARTLAQFGEGLGERQRKSIEAMGRAIVNKLLHGPTVWLRAASEKPPDEAAAAALVAARLFNLEIGDEDSDRDAQEPPGAVAGASRRNASRGA